MKVLVTGGSGFLGQFVVARLLARRHQVIATARRAEAAVALRSLGAMPVACDLDDADATVTAFRDADPQVILNIASLGFGHAATLVRAAAATDATRAVYVSTTAVTTQLDVPSKRIRLAAEDTIRRASMPWIILRPTMIYGAPGDRNMERLLRVLHRAPVFPLPGADHLHQPVHVEDLAATLERAVVAEGTVTGIFDTAGPEPIPFRRLAQDAADALGSRVRLVPVPTLRLLDVARLVERTGRRLPVSAEQLSRLLEDKVFDNTPAAQQLGHRPRPFSAGIADEATLVGLA